MNKNQNLTPTQQASNSLTLYQVDAFSQQLFGGNPAGVVILKDWLTVDLMQSIAFENNLAETAFVKIIDDENYQIRWFSPKVEVAFCGHATLASAFILFRDYTQRKKINFHVKDLGIFVIDQADDGKIQMDFPIRRPHKLTDYPDWLHQAIDRPITEVYLNTQAYILVCASEQDVREAQPNFEVIRRLAGETLLRTAITAEASLDVAITAASSQYDYVARYFAPHIGIDEDPVTGSLHTALAPFWADRLHKNELIAYQASERGGLLYCAIKSEQRIEISGYAVLYMQAQLNLAALQT